MKKSMRKMLMLCFLICLMLVPAAKANAKSSTPYMKKMSVCWDLKKNKQMTYSNYYGGLGLRSEYAKIISYKKKKVGSRYKVTMKIRFECVRTIAGLSPYERDLFLKYGDGDSVIGDYNVVVADYKTGKSLYASNKYGVRVNTDYYNYNETSFTTTDGSVSDSFVDSIAVVSISYPKKYKNLCVGIGGSGRENASDLDEDYYDGYIPFASSSFNCPADKRVMRFMRIK